MRKYILCILMLIQAIYGCSTDNVTITKGDLEAFTVFVGETKYEGMIDNNFKIVRINGITNSSSISKVEWKLGSGVTMLPDDPTSFLGRWEKEMSFSVNSSGRKIAYKVILNDFSQQLAVGYITAWGYSSGKDEIRWKLLTHVNMSCVHVYANADLNEESFTYGDNAQSAVAEAHKHGVKILMSVCTADNKGFYNAIKNAGTRSRLVDNLLECANRYGFDGIDIDYELDEGKDVLAPFSKELYEKKGDLLLTCAVFADEITEDRYPKTLHQYYDWLNIMSYDHGWESGQKLQGQASSYEDSMQDIETWRVKMGAPVNKLVLGLPFYGYSWDSNVQTEHSSGFGGGSIASYKNILSAYPTAWNSDKINETWYNGHSTIRKKCQLAKEKGLRGVMIWHLFYDAKGDDKSLLVIVADELKKK